MQGHHLTSTLLLSLALSLGCQTTDLQKINAARDVCPEVAAAPTTEGWVLGEGEYRAEQSGAEITVFADGDNPTPGYQNILALGPDAESIPTLSHRRKAPSGIVAQALTPYKICARFKAAGTIEQIEIHDHAGKHAVSVKPK